MSDLMPPPPPRRPAPAALRRRIEGELEHDRRRRWFGIVPASVLIAAVAVVIAAVLGVASYQRPMTAEPASTASPAPSATREPSPAPTTAATGTGPATLDLDVRELSGPQVSAQHYACWGKSGTSQRPSSDAKTVYAQQQRWAGPNGPGWNQSQVLIMKAPGADAWVCRDGLADEATNDFADQLTAAAPVYENYGSSTAQCDQRSAVNAFVEKLFQVRAPVALARVRLNVDGQHGPWQTTEPEGGWVHFSIGLVADDAWSESVTIDYEFLDAEGQRLLVQSGGSAEQNKPTPRVSAEFVTCADVRQRSLEHDDPYRPPTNTKTGVQACSELMDQAEPGGVEETWSSRLVVTEESTWGAVLTKGTQRYACSLAPSREVSAIVPDKASTARSSFWFAVNPIDATDGTSFWAAGRVPADVTSITYRLPGGVTVPADLSPTGHWMVMHHVDGEDLSSGKVSTWDPVQVRITLGSGEVIRYEIPFNAKTMCNQISHGC